MELPIELIKEGTMFAVVVMQMYILNNTLKKLEKALNGQKKEFTDWRAESRLLLKTLLKPKSI